MFVNADPTGAVALNRQLRDCVRRLSVLIRDQDVMLARLRQYPTVGETYENENRD